MPISNEPREYEAGFSLVSYAAEENDEIKNMISGLDESTIRRILDDHGIPKQDVDPRQLLTELVLAHEIQSWELAEGAELGGGPSVMKNYRPPGMETWSAKVAQEAGDPMSWMETIEERILQSEMMIQQVSPEASSYLSQALQAVRTIIEMLSSTSVASRKTAGGLQPEFDQAMSDLNSVGGRFNMLTVEAADKGQEALAQYCREIGQTVSGVLSKRPQDDELFPQVGGGTTYQYESYSSRTAEMDFNTWLDTYLSESQHQHVSWEIEGPDGTPHHIDSEVVIEAIKGAPASEQAAIKDMIVKIDFSAGDVNDYFKHLAQALVQNYGSTGF